MVPLFYLCLKYKPKQTAIYLFFFGLGHFLSGLYWVYISVHIFGGAIVNMSSQMSKVGGDMRSVYNMNKAGIDGLTKGMALELAKFNIRVNSVCPTFVATPRAKKYLANKSFKKYALSNIPLGRIATESDVATAITFLASDAASMITGTSIIIDGGWTAK